MGLRVYLELRMRLRVGLEDDGGVVPAEAEIVRDRRPWRLKCLCGAQ